jgi:hypothetical protein
MLIVTVRIILWDLCARRWEFLGQAISLSGCLTVCGSPCVLFTGYPLVGGTRQRHFDGTGFKPRKLPACASTAGTGENAQNPTSRVHAVLGGHFAHKVSFVQRPHCFFSSSG